MRTFATLVLSAFALAGFAFATPIDVANISNNSNVTAACGDTGGTACYFGTNAPANVTNGNLASPWVAPGLTANPFLLVNLGGVYTNVANVQVVGMGVTGLFSAFDVYVGGSSTVVTSGMTSTASLAAMEASMTEVMTVTNQADQTPGNWTDTTTASLYGTAIQYVLYVAIPDTANASAGCASNSAGEDCPGSLGGSATVADMSNATGNQDDAFADEIEVNTTPEPAAASLVGLALLALGLVRRPRK
jgi:hypothetical protein